MVKLEYTTGTIEMEITGHEEPLYHVKYYGGLHSMWESELLKTNTLHEIRNETKNVEKRNTNWKSN